MSEVVDMFLECYTLFKTLVLFVDFLPILSFNLPFSSLFNLILFKLTDTLLPLYDFLSYFSTSYVIESFI